MNKTTINVTHIIGHIVSLIILIGAVIVPTSISLHNGLSDFYREGYHDTEIVYYDEATDKTEHIDYTYDNIMNILHEGGDASSSRTNINIISQHEIKMGRFFLGSKRTMFWLNIKATYWSYNNTQRIDLSNAIKRYTNPVNKATRVIDFKVYDPNNDQIFHEVADIKSTADNDTDSTLDGLLNPTRYKNKYTSHTIGLGVGVLFLVIAIIFWILCFNGIVFLWYYDYID